MLNVLEDEDNNPKFYSKNSIAILTILLSPIFGCILFSYNLSEIGKKQLRIYFIIGGFIWTFLTKIFANGLRSNYFITLFGFNILGSIILSSIIWNKFLGDDISYESKNFWKPTLIFIGICVGLILVQILTKKD